MDRGEPLFPLGEDEASDNPCLRSRYLQSLLSQEPELQGRPSGQHSLGKVCDPCLFGLVSVCFFTCVFVFVFLSPIDSCITFCCCCNTLPQISWLNLLSHGSSPASRSLGKNEGVLGEVPLWRF